MLVGSTSAFYRSRRVVILAACVLPLALLSGAWWLLSNVLLAPAVPGDSTPAEDCIEFLSDAKGLPRLAQADRESLLERLTARCVREPDFLNAALAALRRSEPDRQTALKNNLFAALKPVLMRDIDRFTSMDAAARGEFIDDRIVAYNRLSAFAGQMRPDKGVVAGLPKSDPRELMLWIMSNTTEAERERAGAYLAALGARLAVINADAELRKKFEERIARDSTGAPP